MKKVLYSLAAMALVSLGMTSCQKENNIPMSFMAGMEECNSIHGAKTSLGSDGVLSWEDGEEVRVFFEGTTYTAVYSAHPSADDPTVAEMGYVTHSGPGTGSFSRAYYPSSIMGALRNQTGNNIMLENAQSSADGSLTGFPMVADFSSVTFNGYNQSVDYVRFRNLCGVLKITLQQADVSISSIKVEANEDMTGVYYVDLSGSAPAITKSTESSYRLSFGKEITLQLATAQDITEGKDFYIYLPEGDYTGMTLTFSDNQGGTCVKSCSQTVQVRRSQYNPITISGAMNFFSPTQGVLSGVFSVSADKQVRFSQGNLQYQASTGTWRFAEHQYDYVGADNANISETYTGWIDLFGWGTSGYHNPSDTYNVYYQPYQATTTATGSNNNYYGYGPSYNMTGVDLNLTGTSANYDWGVYNAISNGGNMAGTWRTLTSEEWYYLFNTRTNASSKWGLVQIQLGTNTYANGFVFLPDDFTLPTGCSFSSGRNFYSRNSYTLAKWALMEEAGAIFLPASGARSNATTSAPSNTYYNNNDGLYWTSSKDVSTGNSCSMATMATFGPSSYNSFRTGTNTIYPRFYGLAVRLVRDVATTTSK